MDKYKDLSKHSAIITGVSGGIGHHFVMELARRGCEVILVDVNEDGIYELAEKVSQETYAYIFTLPLDLTEPNPEAAIEDFCQEYDLHPDILINNAGIFSFSPIMNTKQRKIDSFIDLHVRAVTNISRWFARRRAAKGSGWILNMSSMSCWMPMPGIAMYAATKAYIRVFSRSLHYELKDYGIGVTVACPGGIATDLFGLPEHLKELAVKIGVLDTPEKFARKAIDRMLRKKKQYINGWLNRLSIFFVGITPTRVRMMVKHRLLDKGIRR